MPKTKTITKKKTTPYKKSYVRKNRHASRYSTAVVPRTMAVLGKGFPKKLTITHKYFESSGITSTNGALSGYVFSTNSLYDPNTTGVIVGHQPMYFDQCAALYNRYVVIGSRIKVKIMNADANTGLIACGIYIDDDASLTYTTFETLTEQTQASRPKYIAYNATTPITLTSSWSAKKMLSSKQNIIGNSSLQGNPTASPSQQQYYAIYVQCVDGASTVNVYAEVELEYIAVWTELKEVNSS